MNKESIRNGIIGGVVLLAVVAGIFYLKNTSKNEDQNSENEETGIVREDSVLSSVDESLSKKIPTGDTKTKFNNAIQYAQHAFQKKEYTQAISFYTEALSYQKSDVVHAGLYTVYSAQSDWIKAQVAIDSAIQLQPTYTDYWNWKIDLLDEKMHASYQDLKNVYTDALSKVDPKTKINLVTHFARVAENNNEKIEAINLWKYAIELYPSNSNIYQQEIDRLQQSF